jgi:hypothetical protein
MIYIKLLKKTTRIYKSSPERADCTYDGSSGRKGGHERRGDGKDALGNGKNLFDGGKNLLLEEVLLLWGISGAEIHVVGVGWVWGSKGGYNNHGYYISISVFEFKY